MYISLVAKRTRDPEGRRRKILQAAGELIKEIGISAVTHRKVAERARVPLGSTTQYFASLTDMLADALIGLEEEREEKVAEFASGLSEADDPVGLVADMVMESLSDLKRTRNELSFALLYTTHPKLRRFIVPGDAALVEQLSRNIPEATGRAVLAYCYGVLFQATVQETVPPREEIEAVLRRLVGDPRNGGTMKQEHHGPE